MVRTVGKYTTEYVKNELEKCGYKLTSEYKDMRTNFNFICNKGHYGSMCYSSFKRGSKCYKCKNIDVGDRCRLLIEDIRKEFKEYEFELVSENYINTNKPLEYKCKLGHLNTKSRNRFLESPTTRCIKCNELNGLQQRKTHDISTIKDIFKERNCILITENYKNVHQTLEFTCPEGHIRHTTLKDFQANPEKRCVICIGRAPPTIEKLKNEFEQQELTLITKKYEVNGKLKYKCIYNHIYEITYNQLKQYRINNFIDKCKKCNNIEYEKLLKEEFENQGLILLSINHDTEKNLEYICENGHNCEISFALWNIYKKKDFKNKCEKCKEQKYKTTYNKICNFIKNINYEILLSEKEYNDMNIKGYDKLNIICNNNHKIQISFNNLKQGIRCSICNIKSKGEIKIGEYLEKIKCEFIREKKFDDCKNIKKLPFDFYIDNKFIIEYDGNFHFDIISHFGGDIKLKKQQDNDIIKTKYCKDNKIPLLHICYKDYKNIETIIDEFIKTINKPNNKILVKYSREDMYEYLNKN
jgi:hypothetical protein